MAQRRMFSPDIVASDAFLDMPSSSQALYFHLGMYADDDGFVNPKRIMRMCGVSDDDLKVLVGKRFVLPFENGVVIIKHWRINNLVRKDWYRPTQYIEQMSSLLIKENGAYTENKEGKLLLVNESLTVRQHRLGKDSIGKDSIEIHAESEKEESRFDDFWKEYPRKIGKTEARRSWDKLKPSKELADRIVASVAPHCDSKDWKKEDGRFIPLPATYLNQGRYDDEIGTKITNSKYDKYATI